MDIPLVLPERRRAVLAKAIVVFLILICIALIGYLVYYFSKIEEFKSTYAYPPNISRRLLPLTSPTVFDASYLQVNVSDRVGGQIRSILLIDDAARAISIDLVNSPFVKIQNDDSSYSYSIDLKKIVSVKKLILTGVPYEDLFVQINLRRPDMQWSFEGWMKETISVTIPAGTIEFLRG